MRLFNEKNSMYNSIKRSVINILPKKILIKNERFFRNIIGISYLGSNNQCNICNKKLRTFVSLKNEDLLCPFCGALSRTRRLWSLVNNKDILNGHVLHFSPSRNLYREFKKNTAITYFSSDFEDEFLADYKFDITAIKQKDKKFDIIICYHILEHIVDDIKAMQELYRVLKPQGQVYLQTPFKSGEIYEDYTITLPEDREKHFGQNDHVRIYTVEALKSRLEQVGFSVSIKNFKENESDYYNGLKSPETVLIATK